MAKKSVKKAAIAASKKPVKAATKSTSARKSVSSKKATTKPASKPHATKGKAAAAKTSKPSTKAVAVKPAKPSHVKAAAIAQPHGKLAKAAEKNGTPAKNGSAAMLKNGVEAKALVKHPAPVVVKPAVKAEEPKPTGRPMLLQGPIAIKPMGKKATLPPTPPKPAEKPVKKKPLPFDGPAFVVVQPPTKAVATSEKAAKNKAGLGQKDLDYFRDLLLAKRRELLGDMSHMEREALRENSSDLSNLPVHMADQGTDAYEQEFTLHLVEKDRTLLRELNDALAKIQNGTYGICEGTGLPISKARLEAQPWARYSIEHARALEKRQMMFRR